MKRKLPLLLRVLALALLVLPLTGAFARYPLKAPEYVLITDDSLSMRLRFPELAERIPGATAALAARGLTTVAVRNHPLPPGGEPTPDEPLTDLASALTFSLGLFSPRTEKRLLLVTDGLTESGDALRAAGRLAGRGVKVFALRPSNPMRRTGVLDIALPPEVFLWEPFMVKGRVGASLPGQVEVLLLRNDVEVMRKMVNIDQTGTAEVEFLQEAEQTGAVRYALRLSEGDGPAAEGEILVAGAPRVLFVGSDLGAARDLIEHLRGAGIETDLLAAGDLGRDAPDLDGWDALILDDVPSPAMAGPFEERITEAVAREGLGLIVIGGRKSLGNEEYLNTRIESLLPVHTGYSSPPPPAAINLVLAMDTSFSMYSRGRGDRTGRHMGEPRKIDVAKNSAVELVKILRDEDKLGVLGNSTDLYWAQELTHPRDRAGITSRIEAINAIGGGIDFYSIVREAGRALRDDPASIRHIMVFCDADDIDQYEVVGEGHSYELIRSLAAEGITLSILAIGDITDKDVPFLRTASMIGQGDFYLISNIVALPKYFVSEYRKLSSRYYVEEDVGAYRGDFSPLLYGLDGSFPMLTGINTVTPREGSRVPLHTSQGTPLVALGSYGKGKTAVFASDNGQRWARQWRTWPQAQKFWVQLLFAVLSDEKEKSGRAALRADRNSGGFLLSYRTADGGYPEWERLWLHLDEAADGEEPVPLIRRGLQTYRSSSTLPASALYRTALTTSASREASLTSMKVFVPPSLESLPLPENWELVDRIVGRTGGAWVSSPEEVTAGAFHLGLDEGTLFMISVILGVSLLLAEVIVKQQPWR